MQNTVITIDQEQCAICLDSLDSTPLNNLQLTCNHSVHNQCANSLSVSCAKNNYLYICLLCKAPQGNINEEVKSDPASLISVIQKAHAPTCVACNEEIVGTITRAECNHPFHANCFETLLNNFHYGRNITCPSCNAIIVEL